MNDVFREYLDDFMVYYINNIFIFSKNMEDHECHIHLVLEMLWEVGLYTKLENCKFHQSEVEFMVTSFLEMTFAWILVRFKPLLIWLL
jgi:hypothetical protein